PHRTTTRRGRPRLHVYGRTGQPCLTCATPVRVTADTYETPGRERPTYWCPTCQRGPGPRGPLPVGGVR
ncbi:DNA glycosylase, partial [Streptomyces sp. 8K308]